MARWFSWWESASWHRKSWHGQLLLLMFYHQDIRGKSIDDLMNIIKVSPRCASHEWDCGSTGSCFDLHAANQHGRLPPAASPHNHVSGLTLVQHISSIYKHSWLFLVLHCCLRCAFCDWNYSLAWSCTSLARRVVRAMSRALSWRWSST
jgi:hypothetical protein